MASGWEKGVVEKNVQDSRRRIWLDAQKIQWGSFAELNVWLGERCRGLWSELRHPEYKEFSVLEMLEQERAEMMPMPSPFDGYVEKPARVSSTCLVSVARNRYSVPCELANRQVSTRLYPNRVDIAAADTIVASHERLSERVRISYDWQHTTDRKFNHINPSIAPWVSVKTAVLRTVMPSVVSLPSQYCDLSARLA